MLLQGHHGTFVLKLFQGLCNTMPGGTGPSANNAGAIGAAAAHPNASATAKAAVVWNQDYGRYQICDDKYYTGKEAICQSPRCNAKAWICKLPFYAYRCYKCGQQFSPHDCEQAWQLEK